MLCALQWQTEKIVGTCLLENELFVRSNFHLSLLSVVILLKYQSKGIGVGHSVMLCLVINKLAFFAFTVQGLFFWMDVPARMDIASELILELSLA